MGGDVLGVRNFLGCCGGGYRLGGAEMTEVLTYEALKAECDALEDRVNALAVENAALKSKAAELVHEASEVYSTYNATIKEPDGDFMDMQTLYEMQRIETPATDTALASIEARVWAEAKDLAKSAISSDCQRQ